jgi:hypothetical protein
MTEESYCGRCCRALPAQFVDGAKQAFSAPDAIWFRGKIPRRERRLSEAAHIEF